MDKLKAIQIKQAKPKEKPYKLFDGGGLFLDVRPNGSKYWRMKYRFGGKEKLLSIGVFPEITLKEAREKRDFARRQLREDIDPSAQKQIDKINSLIRGENTFRAVAEDWFSTRMREKSENHKKREQGLLKNYLYPTIGELPINEVTSAQLLSVLRKIEANGHFETTKRVKQTAGQVFRFAISTSKAENDPSALLRDALTPHKPKHRPAITDPARFGRLLLDIDHYQGSPVVMTALKLMSLLFCRSGELRHMEWEDINWQKQYWEMPAEKTKVREEHIVPLSKQALALLEKLRSIQTNSAFVFPNPRSAKKPMSDSAMPSLYGIRQRKLVSAWLSRHRENFTG